MPEPKEQNVPEELTDKQASLTEEPAGEISEEELAGASGGRTIRITNIRANAVAIGVSTTFTTAQIQAEPKK